MDIVGQLLRIAARAAGRVEAGKEMVCVGIWTLIVEIARQSTPVPIPPSSQKSSNSPPSLSALNNILDFSFSEFSPPTLTDPAGLRHNLRDRLLLAQHSSHSQWVKLARH